MYEASEVVAIGDAHEFILGQKPFELNYTDQQGEIDRREKVADIDETDD
jgi:hypothetical protein